MRFSPTFAPRCLELRGNPNSRDTANPIVCESTAIRRVIEDVHQVAQTPATVLLLCETGVGKGVIAQLIHDLSPRCRRPMARVSCAAIPVSLIESELFGREQGAYTGALTRQVGRFEAADRSTLFLDEIGELPLDVQVKLLRVLQEKTFERLGSASAIAVDVRIVAATNRNLEDAIRDKTFREDLYYRLDVFPILIPPLRERLEDIESLAWVFVEEFSRTFGKPIESISRKSTEAMRRYAWPGNVRELRNILERAVILANGRELIVRLPSAPDPRGTTLMEVNVTHIRNVLAATHWRVRGRGGAAERLGIHANTLESRMAKLGIVRPKPGDTSLAPVSDRHIQMEREQP